MKIWLKIYYPEVLYWKLWCWDIAMVIGGSILLQWVLKIRCSMDTWIDEFEVNVIQISAPNILSLTIKGDLFLGKLLFPNVFSLVEADLDYTKMGCRKKTHREEMLKGFIRNLSHVKELKIRRSYSKVKFLFLWHLYLCTNHKIINFNGTSLFIPWYNVHFECLVKNDYDMISHCLGPKEKEVTYGAWAFLFVNHCYKVFSHFAV